MVEKSPFFQMGHITKVSTQIHLTIPQYDVHNFFLKTIEWKVPFGGVKVNIFAFRAQQVGLVDGFWWFSVLWSSQINANDTETTQNQITWVFVWLYCQFGTYSSIIYHIILNHYWFLSLMILPSDSESLLLASDSTPTSIFVSVSSKYGILNFWTSILCYFDLILNEISFKLCQSLNSNM